MLKKPTMAGTTDVLLGGLFLLLIHSSTTEASNCTLCPDGAYPLTPEKTLVSPRSIFEHDLFGANTCGELANHTQLSMLPYEAETCSFLQYSYGVNQCGCDPPQDQCTLCLDGSDFDAEAIVGEDGVGFTSTTCQDLADDINYKRNGTDSCSQSQILGHLYCGCPSRPIIPPKGTCSLCDDGSIPTLLNNTVPNDIDPANPKSCERLYLLAPFAPYEECGAFHLAGYEHCGCPYTCPLCLDGSYPNEPDTRFVFESGTYSCDNLYGIVAPDITEDNCPAFQKHGKEKCLCQVEPKRPNNCTLCEDGPELDRPLLEVIKGETCAQVAVDAKRDDYENCGAYQATAGIYCGCENPVAEVNACRLCNGTNLLPNPTRQVTDADGKNVSCGMLEFWANLQAGGDMSCEAFQSTYADCCVGLAVPNDAPDTSAGWRLGSLGDAVWLVGVGIVAFLHI